MLTADGAFSVAGVSPSTNFADTVFIYCLTDYSGAQAVTGYTRKDYTVLGTSVYPTDPGHSVSNWFVARGAMNELTLKADVLLPTGELTLSVEGYARLFVRNRMTLQNDLLVSPANPSFTSDVSAFRAAYADSNNVCAAFFQSVSNGTGKISFSFSASDHESNTVSCAGVQPYTAVHVDIAPPGTNLCHTSFTSLIRLTTDSFAGGEVEWLVSPCGLPFLGSTGPSLTVYPSASVLGTYTVTARSRALPSCGDTCVVNVVRIESVEASCDRFGASGTFGLNPVSFPGGDADFGEPDRPPPFWYIPGTHTSPSSRVLKVFFKYVKDANDAPGAFDIDLKAGLAPGAATNAALNLTWSRLDGPASSGAFNRTDAPEVKFRNPTEGGLYKFRAEAAPEPGRSVHGDAWVLLPKAGGEIAGWMTNEVASAVAAAQAWESAVRATALTNNIDEEEFLETAWLAIATAYFDYQGVVGSPTRRYSFTDADRPDWHLPNEAIPGMAGSKGNGDWDEPSFATLRGIVVSRAKINNAMYAVWGRVLGYRTETLQAGAYWNAARRSLWDDSTSQNAVVLGGALYDAFVANTSMDAVLTRTAAKGLQSNDSPTGLNDVNLWPDDTPVSTGFSLYPMPTDYDSLKDGINTSPRGRFFQQ
jgi:hypothetical protein